MICKIGGKFYENLRKRALNVRIKFLYGHNSDFSVFKNRYIAETCETLNCLRLYTICNYSLNFRAVFVPVETFKRWNNSAFCLFLHTFQNGRK